MEGNISAGKSTFLDVLSHEDTRLAGMLNVVPEPVAQWQEYECRTHKGALKTENVLKVRAGGGAGGWRRGGSVRLPVSAGAFVRRRRTPTHPPIITPLIIRSCEQKFYDDPHRFAYSFQHYVLMSRIGEVRLL